MKRNISKKEARHKRIRAKIKGTASRPRLSVFRSNKHIFAQLIDDEKGVTIASASDSKYDKKNKKIDSARIVGADLAKVAKSKKVESAMFDRGGYRYQGRVKSVAEGAREEGLKF